jgi:hypothetical protein
MNFMPRSKIENYSTSAGGLYSPYILIDDSNSISKKIISGIELIDENDYATLTANKTIQYFESITGSDFAPYKNTLSQLFYNQLDWTNFSGSSLSSVSIINIQDVGDGIKHNSIFINSNGILLTDDPYTNKAKNVGTIIESASPYTFAGYVLYNYGIIVLFGNDTHDFSNEMLTQSTWGNDSYIQHSINMDAYEFRYNCYFPEELNLTTTNKTYYTDIDETDSAITSALTAFWASNYYYSSYTISADAANWIDISNISNINLYATQLGLYNENSECLAVASLNVPFKIFEDMDLTFKIKLSI